MSSKLVTTAIVSAALGFFAASAMKTTQAAPLPAKPIPSDSPLPDLTLPKPIPQPTTTTKSLDGRFYGLDIDARGEILGFGFQTKDGSWGFKGCGARSADHPMLIAANFDIKHLARIQVVDGCLSRYTVWDNG
jgi:hypothetical protein